MTGRSKLRLASSLRGTRGASKPGLASGPRAQATVPFWLDQPGAPGPRPPLSGDVRADLLVVGGGLTGLWTALLAAEEGKSVVLLEGERLAFGASGRNGGFCDASLTHGLGNGVERWPDEMEALERMGRENLAGIEATIRDHGIDCGWEPTGTIAVATAPHQLPWLEEEAEALRGFGWEAELLDRAGVRAHVNSPTYLDQQLRRLSAPPRSVSVHAHAKACEPGIQTNKDFLRNWIPGSAP